MWSCITGTYGPRPAIEKFLIFPLDIEVIHVEGCKIGRPAANFNSRPTLKPSSLPHPQTPNPLYSATRSEGEIDECHG
jgi:hypothetical protein